MPRLDLHSIPHPLSNKIVVLLVEGRATDAVTQGRVPTVPTMRIVDDAVLTRFDDAPDCHPEANQALLAVFRLEQAVLNAMSDAFEHLEDTGSAFIIGMCDGSPYMVFYIPLSVYVVCYM